jgi:hypothetical protein
MSDQAMSTKATKVSTAMYAMYTENTAFTMREGTSTSQNRI